MSDTDASVHANAAIEVALAAVVDCLSPAQLDDLAGRVRAEGSWAPPGGVGPGGQAAVGTLARVVREGRGLPTVSDDAGVALALRLGAERLRVAARSSVRAAWTGPETADAQRLTASVVQTLLAGAESSILIVSYAVTVVSGIKEALAKAAARGVAIDCVFETEEDSRGSLRSSGASNLADVATISFWRWRADQRPAGGAALHAKLIAVDRRDALVTSANLTERAFEDNVELGVLLRNHPVAASIDDHVRQLVRSGVLTRAHE